MALALDRSRGSMNEYSEFLKKKQVSDTATGLQHVPALNPMLFSHQADMVRWALRRGRAALFADCGLGKSPMELEWANREPHECIIVAPLAAARVGTIAAVVVALRGGGERQQATEDQDTCKRQ